MAMSRALRAATPRFERPQTLPFFAMSREDFRRSSQWCCFFRPRTTCVWSAWADFTHFDGSSRACLHSISTLFYLLLSNFSLEIEKRACRDTCCSCFVFRCHRWLYMLKMPSIINDRQGDGSASFELTRITSSRRKIVIIIYMYMCPANRSLIYKGCALIESKSQNAKRPGRIKQDLTKGALLYCINSSNYGRKKCGEDAHFRYSSASSSWPKSCVASSSYSSS